MAKYAIVRVDGRCPNNFENIQSNDFVCELNGDFKPACKNCRYGDTKEQLIRKVEQAIFIAMCKDSRLTNRNLAKFIVEFLGAEE